MNPNDVSPIVKAVPFAVPALPNVTVCPLPFVYTAVAFPAPTVIVPDVRFTFPPPLKIPVPPSPTVIEPPS